MELIATNANLIVRVVLALLVVQNVMLDTILTIQRFAKNVFPIAIHVQTELHAL